MSKKFLISYKDVTYELEYQDKKIVKVCTVETSTWMVYTSYAFFLVFTVVSMYDFFKDVMRQGSQFKKLLKGEQTDYGKLVGFTRANVLRSAMKYSTLAIAVIFLAFSSKRVDCHTDPTLLTLIESTVVYDADGVPVSFTF